MLTIVCAVLITINILFLFFLWYEFMGLKSVLRSLIDANNSIGSYIQQQDEERNKPNEKIVEAEVKKIEAEANLMNLQGEMMKKESKLGF